MDKKVNEVGEDENHEVKKKRVCWPVWSSSDGINKNGNEVTSSMMIERMFGNFEGVFLKEWHGAFSKNKGVNE